MHDSKQSVRTELDVVTPIDSNWIPEGEIRRRKKGLWRRAETAVRPCVGKSFALRTESARAAGLKLRCKLSR